MKWRYLHIEAHDAFENMALDEAVADAVSRGESEPTIRFYRWNPSAVSIGYFQSIKREVAVDECKKRGIHVVRRRTGGGAVYHDSEREITYSIIAPESIFPKDLTESYQMICGYIVDALKSLGFEDARFHPINDVCIGEKKVSGNAQTRRGGVLLQHGTILYDADPERMFTVLTVGHEKLKGKHITKPSSRITSIKQLNPNISYNDTVEALRIAFLKGKDWEAGQWTKKELTEAKKLAQGRYMTEAWNILR